MNNKHEEEEVCPLVDWPESEFPILMALVTSLIDEFDVTWEEGMEFVDGFAHRLRGIAKSPELLAEIAQAYKAEPNIVMHVRELILRAIRVKKRMMVSPTHPPYRQKLN